MKAAPLNTDHVLDLDLHTETTNYLREHGYSVNIQDVYSVVSDSGNSYLVYVIRTHSRPFVDADVVSDQLDIPACLCSSWRYQNGLPDLEEDSPCEWSHCKHSRFVWETLMEKENDTQTNE